MYYRYYCTRYKKHSRSWWYIGFEGDVIVKRKQPGINDDTIFFFIVLYFATPYYKSAIVLSIIRTITFRRLLHLFSSMHEGILTIAVNKAGGLHKPKPAKECTQF